MRLALLFLFSCICVSSQTDTTQDPVKAASPEVAKVVRARARIAPSPPVLGVSLQKPDDMLAAQLPELPAGMGFLVTEVEEGGPASKAGIQVHDVIWKFEDQKLVNKGQLAVLLGLRLPGQQIEISGFRAGKSQKFKVQLGMAKSRFSNVLTETGSNSEEGDNGITQVVHTSEMFAKTTGKDGVAEILKVDEGYKLKIKDSKEKSIYSASIPDGGSFEGVPTAWDLRVKALKRALDRSISGELPMVRPPRPRVVPPPMTAKEPLAP
jgi:hypothetical protein